MIWKKSHHAQLVKEKHDLKYGNDQYPYTTKTVVILKNIFCKRIQIEDVQMGKSEENIIVLNWFTRSHCLTRMLIRSDDYEIRISL